MNVNFVKGFPENLLEDIKKEKRFCYLLFSDQPKMSFAPKYGVKATFSSDMANNERYSTVNFIFHLISRITVINDCNVLNFLNRLFEKLK